jgi:betaine-aldehyde dehydrogenase
MMMAVWKFAPALAAGNTVVLKPSDTTPSSTLLLAEIAAEFLPRECFNVITGDRTTGGLVEHPTPQMVAITGSVRAGMEVAKARGPVKRVHLELGGKAPVVVFDDADIEAAVEGIAVAGYFNAGQDCTAATRVLVANGIHDDFVAALAAYAKDNAKTGAARSATTSVRSRQQLQPIGARVSGIIDASAGATRRSRSAGPHLPR